MLEPKSLDFSTVLASSVHDMKNSVSMLIASLEEVLAEIPKQNPVQAEQVNSLHYEASRINNELVQLLSIYRLQQKHLFMVIDQHYVGDVLEDQVARNYPLIKSRGITLTVNCDDALEAYFDADLIGNVVQNILVNGCRYTKSKLQLNASMNEGFLCISIADDGDGFPESMLDFSDEKKFGSGHSTHLGLYFASLIASMHTSPRGTGRIVLRNGEPLGGGVFELYIPN
ncbi:MAG: HAMP domain-containing sensor histidine kinase [Marinagarivorans sp.]|nr:HAMP domain-containing sensor histidine kinase [Marinagarivorans sp.]